MTAFSARWLADYRRMLKGPELEEPLDVFVYRPLAFILVKAIAATPITPNQVTLASLVPGLASAWFFWQGTPAGYLAGALLLFLTNVLDCVDGMLARVRGAGCVTGYILDGLVDYAIQVSMFAALIHGIAAGSADPRLTWMVGIPAGLSFAWWCARLDRLRGEWQEHVDGRRRDPHVELAHLQEQAVAWRRSGGHRSERFLVMVFAIYVRLWYSGPIDHPPPKRDEALAEWKRRNRPVLRLAVLLGPSTHLSLIIAAALAGRPAWYLWAALIVGTGWGWLVLGLRAANNGSFAWSRSKGVLSASGAAGSRPGDTSATDDR